MINPTNPSDQDGLAGRRALVTGGSQGIGAAIARRLIQGGANVVVTARSRGGECPDGAIFVEGDLRSRESVRQVAERALSALGGLDILVNNAGAGQPFLPGSAAIPDEAWTEALALNLMAAVRLTSAVTDALKQSRAGAIVNVSAGTASPAPGPMLHYLSAKAALNAYTIGLGQELAPSGIRVNLVTPGPVVSPGGDAFRKVLTDALDMPPEALAAKVPLGRLGSPTEVAELVAFLVSDRGRWMTMHNHFVDGGMAAL